MTDSNPIVPGVFCWAEIVTTDIDAARAFYSGLFGWEFKEEPAGDHGTYTMFHLGGKHVAGGYAHGPDEDHPSGPPHWGAYVSVADAEAVVARAGELGGQVMVPAMDVMDSGRMALFADPGGAMLQIWEPKNHRGYDIQGVHGTFCWTELMTRDVAAAQGFYKGLFGWTTNAQDMGSSDPYTVYMQGDRQVAGMMAFPPDVPAFVPPHWLVYFQVDDCDASVARCKELGGALVAGPMDVAEVGRFAVMSDPQGPTFAVIQMHPC